ncbi:MAG: glycosyltransferase family 39 protein [Butyrivibrio sp.]|uniref:hypothetical protein n=1 Tax=Butyrivibrio sp. TaxID=28121 RepID=UPI0025BD15D8|nr:hypothetical protein [Butyrivibrio sp.]MBQ6587550.1 glycosyltransferase family 39 protein [Butyrivibrio sp.]
MKNTKDSYTVLVYTILKCLLAAFVIIAICSKSSFLYPLNNWGDANIYFNVGRGILHGKVPYRDMIDQKGPIIFFVYALGELVSETSFIGIYIIEAVCATIFAFFALKTVSLFYDTKSYELSLAFMMAAIVYSCFSNRHGGGPEEMSVCIFGYLLYLLARYLEQDVFPNTIETVFLGLGAGMLFWTKYNLCAIFISSFVFVIIHAIKRNELQLVWKAFALVLLGVILVTIPIVGYFAANDSITIFFKTYFYDNIFLYRSEKGLWVNLLLGLNSLVQKRNALTLAMLILGLGWMIKNKRYMLLTYFVVSFVFSFVIFNAGYPQKYSNLPLFAFCVFGVLPLFERLEKKNIQLKLIHSVCSVVLFSVLAYVSCIHSYDILRPKSETVQYVFADEIKKSGIEDYSVLYYGHLDEGFYVAANYLPEYRAYVMTNQVGDEFKDLQNSYINNREPDFIITRLRLCDSKDYNEYIEKLPEKKVKEVVAFDDFGYELVDEGSFYFEEYDIVARLYKKIG